MARKDIVLLAFLAGAALFVGVGYGQEAEFSETRPSRPVPGFVVPQMRAIVPPNGRAVVVTGVTASVDIVEQTATTTMDISVRNPTRRRLEAKLLVPVPQGAVVRGFSYQGGGKEPTAELLSKDEARRIYDSIVAKMRDPALLEFIGYNLIRSSVFPVEPNGTQTVHLVYENLLTADGDRVDYILPRSESLDYRVPWQISVKIKSKRAISTVYSPSHLLETRRLSEYIVTVRTAPSAAAEPGAFRLSYLLERNGVTASLFAYPDPKVGGGYFLLLAGLPAKPSGEGNGPGIKREVTMVFDRSGSMSGEKIEQVREAALQILAGLDKGEMSNIIAYNESVDVFSDKPLPKTEANVAAARTYLKEINARGGTNIHDALLEALRQKPAEGTLPIVLFLTDGLPTVGQTSEVAIRNVAITSNPYHRRIFTFGVGVDVNTPLLSKIASETRGTATFVLPKEDVEVKVAQVFKRLAGPVLADPKLRTVVRDDRVPAVRTRDVIPDRLPDVFEGDQLIVLGRYVGEQPLTFELSGNYLGKSRKFEFSFNLDKATTRNAFVPRLWASRKIALLIDAIRQLGADRETLPSIEAAQADPKMKELIDEIIRLSTEFGILTEYTAFLAREGIDLSSRDVVFRNTTKNLDHRAIAVRSGLGGVNQEENTAFMRGQARLNISNRYFDEKMNRVQIANVQQINDRAFYRRGGQWVDSRIVTASNVKPTKVIVFGSDEFHKLARRLAGENRQGCMALRGDIMLVVDDAPVLIKAPGRPGLRRNR